MEAEMNKMPSDWVETRLGEIAEINPSESLAKGKIAKCVPMDCIYSFTRQISRFEEKEFNGGMKFRNGDTLLARITPCLENGKTAYVDFLDKNEIGFGSTEYIVIREKKGFSDKKFLYYWAISPRFREIAIKAMTGTSGRQRVQIDVLMNKDFLLPPLPEQKAIASVLSAFDDKIELLREENKTLEEMGQTIFQEWCQPLNPLKGTSELPLQGAGGLLPVGWRVGKLGEVCNLKSGFAFGGDDFVEKSNTMVLKIKDLKGNGIVDLSDASFVKDEVKNLERVQYFKLKIGDIVLAMSGNTTGKIGVIPNLEEELFLNQRVGKFFIDDEKYKTFIYFFLMSGNYEEKILAMGYGSAQPNINPTQIENIDIIYPDNETLENFINATNPIFTKILDNLHQIQSLARSRDELLPRLMSGEVRGKNFNNIMDK